MPEASPNAEEPTPPPLPQQPPSATRGPNPSAAEPLPTLPTRILQARNSRVKGHLPPYSPGLLLGGLLGLVVVAFLAGFIVRGWLSPVPTEQAASRLATAQARPHNEYDLEHPARPKVASASGNRRKGAVASHPAEPSILSARPDSTVEHPGIVPATLPTSPFPEITPKPRSDTEVPPATNIVAGSVSAATPTVNSGYALPEVALAPSSTTSSNDSSKGAITRTEAVQTLYQQIDIVRQPKFEILGTVTVQDLRYKLLSELKVQPADGDGRIKVDQTILAANLLKADDLSHSIFESSLRALRGWQFSFVLNRQREVVEWSTGPSDERKVAKVKPAKTDGFLLTSILDQDGWKEVAQLTFFVPMELKTSRLKAWTRRFTHDFRPLGSWYGETRFEPRSETDGVAPIGYAHHMQYLPPGKDAAAEGPLLIESAKFQCLRADGELYYDQTRQRVQSAQEAFAVSGFVATTIVGQSIRVAVEEQQSLAIRIFDQKPTSEE